MPPETALAEPISFAHLAGIPPAETAIPVSAPRERRSMTTAAMRK
jgi:hypothetical protein